MDTSKLVPHDARVREETAQIRGKTYSYMIGAPQNSRQPIDTVFLLHGFPDLNFGWRYQIPHLMSLGFRVVAPSMLGYAGTSRPDDLHQWSFKSISDDIKALATKFVGEEGQFLNGMFGGAGPNGERAFTTWDGVQFDNLPLLGLSPLLSREEADHYARQYMRQPEPPMRGPLNWYRTRKINHEEELELARNFRQVEAPALFIAATKDAALPPAMSAGMEKHFRDLTRREVEATHWALVEASEQVNRGIAEWLNKVLNGAIKATL